jgi:7,8-dihydropterin-6-yl-methyl-4-(beta-D-ribofuranosyl)aminobenzene 5'-phosphate synthase
MKPTAGSRMVTEVDRLTIWMLADNYYDTLLADTPIVSRYRIGPGMSVQAQHGLSCFVETVVGGLSSYCMFDYGVDAAGVLGNTGLLGIDLGRTDAFGLSHGHFDHYQGALGILGTVRSRLAPGTPFFVGEEAFAHRYSLPAWASEAQDLGRLDRAEIEALGLRVVEVGEPVEAIPGLYLTGTIPRSTAYEQPSPRQLVDRGAGPEPDDFRGEQALCCCVRGKGLVVLSGCAHVGIVNTVLRAQAIMGCERVHAIVGGFHLVVATPEVVARTVADLTAMRPAHVVASHCTGLVANGALREALPDAFVQSTAAARCTFSAQES